MRTLVNPVMLKPRTVELYVPQVDEVAKDFVKMLVSKSVSLIQSILLFNSNSKDREAA